MAFIEASKTGSDIDAEHITYDNTESGLESENVQGAIDEVVDDIGTINDNLSGFKFYPTGTGIVGLISDDSAYTDEDGNYVVWGTPTAEQLVADNPNTYKSVPSTEDTRGEVGADSATPFSSIKVSQKDNRILWDNRPTDRTIDNLQIGKHYAISIGGMAPDTTSFPNNNYIVSGGDVLIDIHNQTGNNNSVGCRLIIVKATSTSIAIKIRGQIAHQCVSLD